MLGSINPVVNGKGDRIDSLVRAWFHVLGTTLSSGVVAAGLVAGPWGIGGLGWLSAAAVLAIALLSSADVFRVRLRMPQPSWQVPPIWRDRFPEPWGYPFLWGILLGLGFTTVIPSSALYAIALSWLVWPTFAALAFLAFGISRGLAVLVGQLASDARPPADVVLGVWRLTEVTRLANAVVTMLVGTSLSWAWSQL
jgi:hypothetical protein